LGEEKLNDFLSVSPIKEATEIGRDGGREISKGGCLGEG